MRKKISIEKRILSENDMLANQIQKKISTSRVLAINVMASPGAGKTSFIKRSIEALKDKYRIGVIDGDVVDIDLKRLESDGVQLSLANTGGACHLDATMMKKALASIDLGSIDLLIVENVGNLICPANFLIGTDFNIVIASVPEGADKPYKYPGMFRGADVVVLNKIDYLEIEDFDSEYFQEGVRRLNREMKYFEVSCKNLQGIDQWIEWLEEKLADKLG